MYGWVYQKVILALTYCFMWFYTTILLFIVSSRKKGLVFTVFFSSICPSRSESIYILSMGRMFWTNRTQTLLASFSWARVPPLLYHSLKKIEFHKQLRFSPFVFFFCCCCSPQTTFRIHHIEQMEIIYIVFVFFSRTMSDLANHLSLSVCLPV